MITGYDCPCSTHVYEYVLATAGLASRIDAMTNDALIVSPSVLRQDTGMVSINVTAVAVGNLDRRLLHDRSAGAQAQVSTLTPPI